MLGWWPGRALMKHRFLLYLTPPTVPTCTIIAHARAHMCQHISRGWFFVLYASYDSYSYIEYMCGSIHTHIDTEGTYMHSHTYIHTYIHTCIHTCIHDFTHTHTYIHTYIHAFTHAYMNSHIPPPPSARKSHAFSTPAGLCGNEPAADVRINRLIRVRVACSRFVCLSVGLPVCLPGCE